MRSQKSAKQQLAMGTSGAPQPSADRRSNRLLKVDVERNRAAVAKIRRHFAGGGDATSAQSKRSYLRLESLETDRPKSSLSAVVAESWDVNVDSDVERFGDGDFAERAPNKRSAGTSVSAQGGTSRLKSRGGSRSVTVASVRKKYRRRTIEELMIEEEEAKLEKQDADADYFSREAAPSKLPPRPLCVVCLCFGRYACRTCGSRFCSVACGKTHSDLICSTKKNGI
eukprot:TRINITY_DN48864_c0_g1_i1.p1 TRINITY_DN48864_c0_g1~~TRINITY_DN48864_c0_g1_i1.p1  ORF type:complete len:226 (-),score=40.39 TRINITY_DN48864_c0_g1_i1:133-810(-)